MSSTYSLLIQSADRVSWNPGLYHRKRPNLHVEIDQGGGRCVQTPTMKRDAAPKWGFATTLSADSSSASVVLRLYHDTTFPGMRPACLGECKTTVDELLQLCSSNGQGELDMKTKNKVSARLSVRLRDVGVGGDADVHSQGGVDSSRRDSSYVEKQTLSAPSRRQSRAITMGSVHAGGDLLSVVAEAIARLEPLVHLGAENETAMFHLYIHTAWKIFSSVHQAVKIHGTYHETNTEKISKLVYAVVQLYSFTESEDDVNALGDKIKMNKPLETLLVQMAKQTLECAIFVRECGTQQGFAGHIETKLGFSKYTHARRIDALSDGLMAFKNAFDNGTALAPHAAFVSAQVQSDTPASEAEAADFLALMMPVDYNFSHREACLAGTRHDVLADITEWLTKPTGSRNVFWLHGPAGSGKSAVATSIAHFFQDVHRLGAFVFFERDDVVGSSARGFVHGVACALARMNPHIRIALKEAVEADPKVLVAPVRTQFKRLVLEPLVSAQSLICGPLVIVVDGLGEGYPDPTSRDAVLAMIAEDFAHLPAFVRVLVTSRDADADITPVRLHAKAHVTSFALDHATERSRRDMMLFIRHSLQTVRRTKGITDPTWPGAPIVQTLAEYAGDSFIWAATACKFLHHYNPKKRIAILLAPGHNTAQNLDSLYTVALQNSVNWSDAGVSKDVRAILGALILARMPLTEKVIDALLGFADGTTTSILRLLGCFVEVTPGGCSHLLHASFFDYLTTSHHSLEYPWYIDAKRQSQTLALGCLQVLNAQLRFNICNLEDSHMLRAEVQGLSARVSKNVPAELAYAVRYWASHLDDSEYGERVLIELKKFLHHGFLYWLETLSVLGQVEIASGALKIANNYAGAYDEELADFLLDALRFVSGFASVIAHSAPHVYISALPFAPPTSLVRQKFAPSFPNVLRYEGPCIESWPSLQKVLQGHARGITSVAFSPSGKQVASGSWDNTVHVWNADTGALEVEPLRGHTNGVCALAFSPQGRWLATGSADKTLRIWDSSSGAMVAGPFVGHKEGVTSIAFSPDGTRIASGSFDRSARVWDSKTGAAMSLFEGHTSQVHSVAFSPDGKYIVTASADKTARVWVVATGAVVTSFKKHTHWVNSVSFSPSGKLIASASNDHLVFIWDARSGAVVAGPFKGHEHAVLSVAFSSDELYVVSGSADTTVRFWDLKSGALAAGPFRGHTGIVTSVGFSIDGRRVVSASDDCSVRIWDVNIIPRAASTIPDDRYTGGVGAVAYSPDGSQIVSGSADGTLWIWDSATGKPLVGPFEGHLGKITSVEFSPDGKQIASGSSDETIRLWDAHTGDSLQILKGHKKPVMSISFSPNGKHLVSGSQDKSLRLWNLETSVVAASLKAHSDWVTSVAFSPTGNRIASASDDQTVYVWDAQTGAAVAGPLKHKQVVASVAFSPDGKRIVSGSRGNMIRIWDAESGASIAGPFEGHTDWINCTVFSPDGKYIASGSDDGTVRVWDAATGALVFGPLLGHSNWVRSIAFSPDGKRIVSGSEDKTIRMWNVELGERETKQINPRRSIMDWNKIETGIIDWGNRPRFENRWILNSSSERLMRIPSWLSDDFCYPWNAFVIRPDGTDTLDLSDFVHGTEWVNCIGAQLKSSS